MKSYCPFFAFRCRYGACVDKKVRCNGVNDCADGSDEDYLLCGASMDLTIVNFNTSGNVLPGSCKLPKRSDIRYINNVFQEEYLPGAFVINGEFIEVMCTRGLAMNVSSNFDFSNSCENSRWKRSWLVFPECQSKMSRLPWSFFWWLKLIFPAICSGADITGRTIRSICEFNGKIVTCNQQHQVNTIALVQCGSHYDPPKDSSHLSKKL